MIRPTLFLGLASVGMGHAMRAEPILRRLSDRFCVHVFCGGSAHAYLASKFEHVHSIHRPRFFFAGSRLLVPLIYLHAWLTLPWIVASGLKIFWLALRLRPKAILTDLEAHTAYAGLAARLFLGTPLISLGNAEVFRCRPPSWLRGRALRRFYATRVQLWGMVPYANRYLACHVLPLDGAGPRGRFAPPPIREEVEQLATQTRTDGPVVVYLSKHPLPNLDAILAQTSLEYLVFAEGAPPSNAGRAANVRYASVPSERFLAALANAPFVVTSAGHSLIADALRLGKPVLALPIHGHLEQQFNALSLEHLGAGQKVDQLTPGVLDEFASRPEYARAATQCGAGLGGEKFAQVLLECLEEVGVELGEPMA